MCAHWARYATGLCFVQIDDDVELLRFALMQEVGLYEADLSFICKQLGIRCVPLPGDKNVNKRAQLSAVIDHVFAEASKVEKAQLVANLSAALIKVSQDTSDHITQAVINNMDNREKLDFDFSEPVDALAEAARVAATRNASGHGGPVNYTPQEIKNLIPGRGGLKTVTIV